MNTTIEESIEALKSIDSPKARIIPITFFKKRANKTTKLVNNTEEKGYISSVSKQYDWHFEDAFFITEVEVSLSNFSDTDKFFFSWVKIDGSIFTYEQNPRNDSLHITINQPLKSFSFTPPKKYLKEGFLLSINFYGMTVEDMMIACDNAAKIHNIKTNSLEALNKSLDDLNQAQIDKENIDQEIITKNNNLEEIKTELSSLIEQREKIINETRLEKSNLDSTKKIIEDISDTLDIKRKESEILNSDITQKENRLKKLQSDINIFPSEFEGFVSQGGRNIAWYMALSLIPIAILVLYTNTLFDGAANLTTILDANPKTSVWSAFISRLPFVFISMLIIHACYAIAKTFIKEIIKINQQRLSLAKISIIAKEVSDASLSDLDVSDEEAYQLRTKLKMDLIKSHLKDYISKDYQHSLDASLWSRYLSKKRPSLARSETDI